MTILVLGTQGQVGQSIQQCAAYFPQLKVIGLTRQQCDLLNPEDIGNAIKTYQPRLIINATAHTAVDQAETDVEAAYGVNYFAVKALAQLCQQHDITLFHISTDYVFDGQKTGRYVETDVCQPLSVYGHSKWLGEQAIINAMTPYLILRTSWVFSPFRQNFVKTMLKLGKDRDTLNIIDDQHGGPTPATAIANTLLTLSERFSAEQSGVYHYAGQPHTTWFSFAQQIFTTAKPHMKLAIHNVAPIPTSQYPTPATRPLNSRLDCSKIYHTFGIEPPNWQAILEQEFYQYAI